MLDKTELDISKEWGDAAWFAWQWAIKKRTQGEIAASCGYVGPSRINIQIVKFIERWIGTKIIHRFYTEQRIILCEMALNAYIDSGGILVQPQCSSNHPRYAAESEYAFLMKCEGETITRISQRLGLSRERVIFIIDKESKRLTKAMRRTRVYFT